MAAQNGLHRRPRIPARKFGHRRTIFLPFFNSSTPMKRIDVPEFKPSFLSIGTVCIATATPSPSSIAPFPCPRSRMPVNEMTCSGSPGFRNQQSLCSSDGVPQLYACKHQVHSADPCVAMRANQVAVFRAVPSGRGGNLRRSSAYRLRPCWADEIPAPRQKRFNMQRRQSRRKDLDHLPA